MTCLQEATAAAAINGLVVAQSPISVTLATQCGGMGTHPLIISQVCLSWRMSVWRAMWGGVC